MRFVLKNKCFLCKNTSNQSTRYLLRFYVPFLS